MGNKVNKPNKRLTNPQKAERQSQPSLPLKTSSNVRTYQKRKGTSSIERNRFRKGKKFLETAQGHIIYSAVDLQNNSPVFINETYKTAVESNPLRSQPSQILKYLSCQPDVDEGICRTISEWETDDCFCYAMQSCE
eukprot:107322_1